jgi:hypothetical protein
MMFGFFVGAADPAGLCAMAVSAAAAAAVVPNMNSRRLVGNANSLLNRFADLALTKGYGDFLRGEIARNDNNRGRGGFQIYSACCRFA